MPQRAKSFRLRAAILVTLCIVTSIGSGWLLFNWLQDRELTKLGDQQQALLISASNQLHQELGNTRDIMRLIGGGKDLREALQGQQVPDIDKLRNYLLNFGEFLDKIYQLRWLDQQGHERVRINFTEHQISVVPAAELQNKADRYYVRAGFKVAPPEVYLSPIDLNVEHGHIELPYRPSLRASYQTGYNDQLLPGLLIANIDLTLLLKQLRALSTAEVELSITNSRGNWLLHPDPLLEWGSDRGDSRANMSSHFPERWQHLHSGALFGTFLDSSGLISFSKTSLISDADLGTPSAEQIWFVAETPADSISAIRRASLQPALALGLGLFLLGSFLCYQELRHHWRQWHLSVALEQRQQALQKSNTALENALQQQVQLQDDLVESRKLSALGLMVAGVAHELNTPTGGALIITYHLQQQVADLQTALETGLTRQHLEDFIQSLNEGLQLSQHHLQHAADLIKSFRRLAVERATEDLDTFKLQTVVDDLLISLRSLIKARRIEVVCQLPEDLTLTSYPGVLSQILQNLFSNAISHGLANHPSPRIDCSAKVINEATIELKVTDNGTGIHPDMQKTLFDPFATSGRGRGHTGLGMHMVRQWVSKVLGGTIGVSSSVSGTCITLTIPRQAPHHGLSESAPVAAATPPQA